ncbi:unnamed protein product [Ostreobium quekettii]|uniref:Uncharacterized protein n=1 Tax=Ostreobium quekettii TaxID=121088 RepID=A0A8S1IZ14_9CHLO|nr:unnamed protein product [Ostreobium quekettii]
MGLKRGRRNAVAVRTCRSSSSSWTACSKKKGGAGFKGCSAGICMLALGVSCRVESYVAWEPMVRPPAVSPSSRPLIPLPLLAVCALDTAVECMARCTTC